MKTNKINTKLIATGLSFVMVGSFAGCAKQAAKDTKTNNTPISTVETMYNDVNKELDNNLLEKDINASAEEEKAFTTVLNMDYISTVVLEDECALNMLYPDGITSDEFISKYERFIDAYREYVLTNNSFISLSSYLIDETTNDYYAFKYIDNIILRDMDNKDTIKADYDLLLGFFKGETEIKLENEKTVTVTDLSYGAQMVIEEYGKLFSILSKDTLTTEARAELDNILVAHNSKSHIVNNIKKFVSKDLNEDSNIGIIGEADKEKVEAYNKVVSYVKETLKDNVEVKENEAESVVITANMEYFDPTTLEVLVSNIGSIEDVMNNSNSLLNKIANKNVTNFVPYIEGTEKYVTDVVGTLGTEKVISGIDSTNGIDKDANANYLFRFFVLDPKASYSYNDAKVDYNTLTEGAKYVSYKLTTSKFETVDANSEKYANLKEVVNNYDPENILVSFYTENCKNKGLTK